MLKEADLEEAHADSDVEYWKIEDNGTMNMVFRAPQICGDCGHAHWVFRMRGNDKVRCVDCDRLRYSLGS